MNRIALDLGFIAIEWYSIFMVISLIVAMILIDKEAKKRKINKEFTNNLIFWTTIWGIIGSRLYYVAFNWNFFGNNLLDILKVWQGGLAIHGAILFGAIFIIIYCKKYNVSILRITDIISVALILGQAIGRWGNFFNSEAHGTEVTRSFLENLRLPNFIIEGMNINGTYYHPTFLYESIWNLIGFIVLIVLRKFKYLKIGTLTAVYFIWYGAGRLFIEGLRTDSLMLGDFRIAQVISVVLIITGIIILIRSIKGSKFDNLYKNSEEADIKF